ncbi:MAG TPA: cupredoxin domain-containing protein [Solirubrobacterales bacterium]|jgi:plastocyanin
MTTGWVNWRRRLALALVTAIAVASFAGLRAAAGESATATASRAKTERIANFEYQPTPLTVSAGTTVTFSNASKISHTATENGGGFRTGVIKPGESASVTFKRAGTYVFHCSIHPFMHGKIVVR